MNDNDSLAFPSTPDFQLRDDDLLLFNPVECPCIKHVADIISLDTAEEDNNKTRICFAERTALVRKPLRMCMARLNPKTFFHVNRSCIVNLAYVRSTRVIPSNQRCYVLILSNDREVLLSRRRALEFKEIMAL